MTVLQPFRPAAVANPATLTLGHCILSSARRLGWPQRPLIPAGHLGLTALTTLAGGGHLDELTLRTAAQTELQLRYGAAIPRLTVLGASDYAIAVAFVGQPIAQPKGDPVDIITPWQVNLPLERLQDIVETMLSLPQRLSQSGWQTMQQLRSYAADLALWPSWPDPRTRLLLERTVAADMTLILELCGTTGGHI